MSFSLSVTLNRGFNNNNVIETNVKVGSAVTLVSSKETIHLEQQSRLDNSGGFLPIESARNYNLSCAAEKRKWSEVNAHKLLHQFTSGNDSSSSDDEIKEICSHKTGPLVFSSSPPGKVTVLSKHSAFSSRVNPTFASDGHSRKKHRLVFAEDVTFTRPSLNLEKMQQVKTSCFKFYSLKVRVVCCFALVI